MTPADNELLPGHWLCHLCGATEYHRNEADRIRSWLVHFQTNHQGEAA